MAKKKKEARQVITLECTEARALGKSPSRYSTMKNKKNTPKRLELKKYNPSLRRHTIHKEIKNRFFWCLETPGFGWGFCF